MKSTPGLIALSLGLLFSTAPAVSQQAPSTTAQPASPESSGTASFGALDAYKHFNEEIQRLDRDSHASIERLKQLDRDWPTLGRTVDQDLAIAQRTVDLYNPNGEIA